MMDEQRRLEFSAITGSKYAIYDPVDLAPYLKEPRGRFKGNSPLLLKPGTVEEVSHIMTLATKTATSIVPQGGNSGLVGGQVPLGDVIVSLERLNRIRDLDPRANIISVDGGVVLADIHTAAEKADRLFPLSLASEGSCQIGGNLSTNAGGTAVLAYGNARQLCLGLEVVLPSGEIWNAMRRLKKDNSGYDLRDLFIGAEGTLGIITGANLKLFPKPAGIAVAMVGLSSPEMAMRLFDLACAKSGANLTGFELIPRFGLELVMRHIASMPDPLTSAFDWYVLIEISTCDSAEAANALLELILTQGLERSMIGDAAIATSIAQRKALWALRENMSEAQRHEGGSIKHDISVPISSIPAFLEKAQHVVLEMIPGARICAFGHLGDGNIHYNISQPEDADREAFLEKWEEVNEKIHAIVLTFDGSISAEHGIGQLKRDALSAIRDPIEIDLMRRIKRAFDPAGIMNPGKVVTS